MDLERTLYSFYLMDSEIKVSLFFSVTEIAGDIYQKITQKPDTVITARNRRVFHSSLCTLLPIYLFHPSSLKINELQLYKSNKRHSYRYY